MKITKSSHGTKRIQLSKQEWEDIGKQAEWLNKRTRSSQTAGINPNTVNQNPLNKRQRFMLQSYNKCLNKNIPVTYDGYVSVGRSQGIIRSIASNPQAFHKFCYVF